MAKSESNRDMVVARAAMGPRPDVSALADAFVSFADIGRLLRRYGPFVAALTCVGLLGGLGWAMLTPTAYTATAQLVIDPKAVQLSREEAREHPATVETAQVESQMAVMRSERIAAQVIRQLDLMKEPLFAKAAQGVSDADVALQLAAQTFVNRLNVRRQGPSYVIDVSFSAPEPRLAARIATGVAEAYVADAREARTGAARVGAEWLERRVAQLRQNMNDAALALQEFKAGRDYRIYRRSPAPAAAASGGDAAAAGVDGKPAAAPDGTVRFDRNTLEELETTAQSYRKIYESALQGYAEAVQRQSNPLIDTRVLAPATPPLGKSQPRPKLLMALGALLGLLGGTGLAVLHWNLDRSLRTPTDARAAMQTPCLGVLPMVWRPALRRGWFEGGSLKTRMRSFLLRLGRRLYPSGLALFRNWNFIRPDDFQQSMANAVTLMATLERDNDVRTIGVTSARRGEGKSTVAGNLACLLAASGYRILLIDADFRHAALSRAAGFRHNGQGLAHVLLGRAHVRDSLVAAPASGVTLLPAEISAGATFDALLGSAAMGECLDEAVAGHDVVIIDLPSLEDGPAALAAAPLLSGMLVIVQWGTTTAQAAASTVDELRGVGGRIIGSILNKAA